MTGEWHKITAAEFGVPHLVPTEHGDPMVALKIAGLGNFWFEFHDWQAIEQQVHVSSATIRWGIARWGATEPV